MIVNINNLNAITAPIDKNSPIFLSYTEAVDMQMMGFQNFRVQTRIEWTGFKQIFLFLEFPFNAVAYQVCQKTFGKWKYLHMSRIILRNEKILSIHGRCSGERALCSVSFSEVLL